MLVAERQKAILTHLAKNGNVSVSELCHMFDVSEMTIRRDLNDLQKQGHLQRTYGGAIPTEPAFFEMSQRAKLSVYVQEKERMGQFCADMVSDGEVVFLDSGTTTLYIAKNLRHKTLSVLTNDLNIASELLDCANITLYVTGGVLRRGTNNLVGSKTISFFDDLRGHKLFLGVEGVDINFGLTVPDPDEVPIKRKMMKSVEETIVVADHSKIGRNSMGVIAPLAAADCLVTDSEAPEELITAMEAHLKVYRA